MLRVRFKPRMTRINPVVTSVSSAVKDSNSPLLDQELFKCRRRKRFTKQKSLHDVTLERTQILKLFLRLNSFRDHGEIQRMAQVDDRAHDRRVVRIFANVGNETTYQSSTYRSESASSSSAKNSRCRSRRPPL